MTLLCKWIYISGMQMPTNPGSRGTAECYRERQKGLRALSSEARLQKRCSSGLLSRLPEEAAWGRWICMAFSVLASDLVTDKILRNHTRSMVTDRTKGFWPDSAHDQASLYPQWWITWTYHCLCVCSYVCVFVCENHRGVSSIEFRTAPLISLCTLVTSQLVPELREPEGRCVEGMDVWGLAYIATTSLEFSHLSLSASVEMKTVTLC